MYNREQILFIRPSHDHDFLFENIRKSGYNVIEPYKSNMIFFRFIRLIWFKYNFPFQKIWFKKDILKYQAKLIIIFDSLITKKYLLWLRNSFPDVRIIFMYGNLVGRASHIKANNIPKECFCEKWSYDKGDCEKYSMNYCGSSYFEHLRVNKIMPLYDVFYVGRDKGRAEYLFNLEAQLQKQRLKTYFYIVADRKYKRFFKYYYKPALKYGKICDLLSKSKAVLNIILDNQTGVTIRDMEALFNEIKLITNNKLIKEYDFYKPENIFILDENNIDEIKDFLDKPFIPVNSDIVNKYTFSNWLKRIIEAKE